MKGKTHLALGAITGAGIYVENQRRNKENISGKGIGFCALLGLIGGILPDILEPATSCTHRKIWHSIFILLVIIGIVWLIYKYSQLDNDKKVAIKSFAGGYVSHLVGDFTTPAQLPLA